MPTNKRLLIFNDHERELWHIPYHVVRQVTVRGLLIGHAREDSMPGAYLLLKTYSESHMFGFPITKYLRVVYRSVLAGSLP